VTGMTTYYGPMFFSFAVNADPDFTLDYWQKALFSKGRFALTPATRCGNYMDLNKDLVNEGYHVIREGHADGILVGGHLPSLNLLQGTRYLPELEGAILFIEICDRYGKDTVAKFNQYLDALFLQKGADRLAGLLVGRLLKEAAVSSDDLKASLLARENLKHLPVIMNVDFGHTTPMVTLPIGGRISIQVDQLLIAGLE
jgi:muramoyltetrapeptide carboxypeptidase